MRKHGLSAALVVLFVVNLLALSRNGWDWLNAAAVALCGICIIWSIAEYRRDRDGKK